MAGVKLEQLCSGHFSVPQSASRFTAVKEARFLCLRSKMSRHAAVPRLSAFVFDLRPTGPEPLIFKNRLEERHMKNYQSSDYAANKYSGGIVYRFADGRRLTVTLADYLAENPGKTGADFAALKQISDALYLDQVRAENTQTKKNVSVHGLEEGDHFGGAPPEEEFLDALDREAAAKAFAAMLTDRALTETQERRFRMSVFGGMTQREIAAREGVTYHAVALSLNAALDTLKKYFGKF
jgi:hypothetical protein